MIADTESERLIEKFKKFLRQKKRYKRERPFRRWEARTGMADLGQAAYA